MPCDRSMDAVSRRLLPAASRWSFSHGGRDDARVQRRALVLLLREGAQRRPRREGT